MDVRLLFQAALVVFLSYAGWLSFGAREKCSKSEARIMAPGGRGPPDDNKGTRIPGKAHAMVPREIIQTQTRTTPKISEEEEETQAPWPQTRSRASRQGWGHPRRSLQVDFAESNSVAGLQKYDEQWAYGMILFFLAVMFTLQWANAGLFNPPKKCSEQLGNVPKEEMDWLSAPKLLSLPPDHPLMSLPVSCVPSGNFEASATSTLPSCTPEALQNVSLESNGANLAVNACTPETSQNVNLQSNGAEFISCSPHVLAEEGAVDEEVGAEEEEIPQLIELAEDQRLIIEQFLGADFEDFAVASPPKEARDACVGFAEESEEVKASDAAKDLAEEEVKASDAAKDLAEEEEPSLDQELGSWVPTNNDIMAAEQSEP